MVDPVFEPHGPGHGSYSKPRNLHIRKDVHQKMTEHRLTNASSTSVRYMGHKSGVHRRYRAPQTESIGALRQTENSRFRIDFTSSQLIGPKFGKVSGGSGYVSSYVSCHTFGHVSIWFQSFLIFSICSASGDDVFGRH